MVVHRFWHSENGLQETRVPKLAYWYFSFKMLVRSKLNGYGLYTKEELYDLGRRDMKAINTLIGNKKFLFGDKPCEADAMVFGLCAQLKYNDQGPFNKYLHSKYLISFSHIWVTNFSPWDLRFIFEADCQNLLRLLDTIQQTYWPDWEANTQAGRRKLKAAAAAAAAKK